jgi:hypothetical protein
MKLRNIVAASLLTSAAGAFVAADAGAVPLTNQFVPIAVIDTATATLTDAFGVTYDPVNDVIWHNPTGGGVAFAFTPLKNLAIGSLPIDGFTGLPALTIGTGGSTPGIPSFEALGFNSATGSIAVLLGGGIIMDVAPFTGVVGAATAGCGAATSFLDGLDIEGTDCYQSAEDGSRDSLKNGALFLDDTVAAQTDISAVSAFSAITRWAGVEAVTSLGFVYATAELDFGFGRTIATYDLSGALFAVDPDGSPFASRIEDLAFDGRYLYGASLGDARIFVFDIVGPGGTVVPEPGALGLLGLSLAGIAYLRRRGRVS